MIQLKLFIAIYISVILINDSIAQNIQINEIQSSNISTIYDHTGNTPDWIELYNSGAVSFDLTGFGLSDNDSIPMKWTFPSTQLAQDEYLLIFASGLNLKDPSLHWETIIDLGDEWRYLAPTSEIEGNWRNIGFNDSSWLVGKSGFGYGDSDDSTQINKTMSVFLRNSFTVSEINAIKQAYLHIDYDDAFVAYLNGVEIARGNIGQQGEIPAYNAPADNFDHEASMYQGGKPEEYLIENLDSYLLDGENVLAIQVHNHSLTSSDLSAIPFFTLGHQNKPTQQISVSSYLDLIPIGLHTNFKISADGEPVILSDPTGKQIDSVYTGSIIPDISLGRQQDGSGKLVFFAEPTPGFPNYTEGYEAIAMSNVEFSHAGGFYPGAITLELTSTGYEDSIYYTLDGSAPNSGDLLYDRPISLSTNSVIRARVIKSAYLPGDVASHNYLIGSNHELPVVAVNTNPENLWDIDYGIYTLGDNASSEFPHFGANFWEDWERPANISMFELDGSLAFQIDAGIKIFGNWSRGQAQKSLSVHTRKSYGYDGIYHKIFEEKELDFFKTIVLRNSGNDFNNTMLRDAFCNKIVSARGIDQQAYRPAVVYLNGDYWGIHNIREKVNEEFIATNHNIKEENIDILEKNGEVVRGSADHYEAMLNFIAENSLKVESNYNYIKTQMDIENFIQYQVAEIFIDNRDWPGNNIKFWRERNAVSKWRWIMFDSDFGINTWGESNQEFNTLEYALEPNGPGWPNPPWSTFLFRSLMDNVGFKHDFINAFADNLNTIFDPVVLNEHLDMLVDGIDEEIDDHLSKWNGDKGYWNNRISAMRLFINNRRRFMRNHITATFGLSGMFNLSLAVEGNGSMKLNTLELNEFPWSGEYFNNVPIQLEAIPDPGYQFVAWRGIENESSEKLKINTAQGTDLVAVFEPIDDQLIDIVINEINYNSHENFDAGDWVELLNAGDHAVNLTGWVLKDNDDLHEYKFAEGVVIHAHDYLVVCRDRNGFLTQFPMVKVQENALNFGLGSSGDCVRLFDANGGLRDVVCYENSEPWPEEANGQGASLSLMDVYSNNAHPANWKSSKEHGTPGAKNNDIITVAKDAINQLSDIKVYPNPAKSEVIIEFEHEFQDKLNVSLLDMTGRKYVLVENQQVNIGINSIPISLKKSGLALTPGVYLLQVQSSAFQKNTRIVIDR